MVEVFQNARLDGKVGIVIVTDEDVTFVESNSLKQTKSEFSVAHIKKLVAEPSTKIVELKLELGDIKDSVFLQMMSGPDVDRFCKRLNEKIQQRAAAAETSTVEPVASTTAQEVVPALTAFEEPTDVPKTPTQEPPHPQVGAIPSTAPLPRKGVRHSTTSVPPSVQQTEGTPQVGAFSSTAPLPRKGVRHSTMTLPSSSAREEATRELEKTTKAEPEKTQVGAFSSTAALPRKGARQSTMMAVTSSVRSEAQNLKNTESGLSTSSEDGDYEYLEDDGEFADEESAAHAARRGNPLMASVKAELDGSVKTTLEPLSMSVRQRTRDETDGSSEKGASILSIPDTCARRISKVRQESQRNMMDSSSRRRRESQKMADSSTPGATSVRRASQNLKDTSAQRREFRESQKAQSKGKGSMDSSSRRATRAHCESQRNEKEMDSSSSRCSSRMRRESQKTRSMSESSTSNNVVRPEMSDASAHRVSMTELERQNREQEKVRSFTLTTNNGAGSTEHTPADDLVLQAKKAMLNAPAKSANSDAGSVPADDLALQAKKAMLNAPAMSANSDAGSVMSKDLEHSAGTELTAAVSAGIRPSRSTRDLLAGNNLVEAMLVDSDEFDKGPSIIASAVDVDQEIRQQKKFKIRIAFGCVLALVAIIVLSVLAATNAFGGDSGVVIPELTPEERFALIKQNITTIVYDKSSLEDPDSPQSLALNWLVKEDTLHKDLVNMDDELLEKVSNRFFLAVFFFSMTGGSATKWKPCHPPETGESNACVHPLLESYAIHGVYHNQNMREAAFRWLSGGDECGWAGVSCSDGVHVSRLHLGKGQKNVLNIARR